MECDNCTIYEFCRTFQKITLFLSIQEIIIKKNYCMMEIYIKRNDNDKKKVLKKGLSELILRFFLFFSLFIRIKK